MAFKKTLHYFVRISILVSIAAAFTQSERFTQSAKAANPFTAGNIVIYRVGSGSGSLLNTGNPVFLDEYTPAGALVQSIQLPTDPVGSNRRFIASGTATSEGL